MESAEDLHSSLVLYEKQLAEVKTALVKAAPEERAELESLESTIQELLDLTRQSLNSRENGDARTPHVSSSPALLSSQDPLDAEYALFKAELADLGGEAPSEDLATSDPSCQFVETNAADLQEELEELVGERCEAPFTDKLQATHYYNALVLSTHIPETASDLQHIQVKVMFINPTEKEMVPCPFYLDGRCKFDDKRCNYSHGYIVPLSQLREYREPNFSLVKEGCSVLARISDGELWVSSRVEEILSVDTVSVRHAGLVHNIPLHHVLPLTSSSPPGEDRWSLDEESQEAGETENVQMYSEAAVERSLMDPLSASYKLGDWEKHTRGIGSKLMAKMGYVVGAGLGRNGEGRLCPVQAEVLPPGKSLDHCMNLREAAGGSGDLFSAERLQKKLTARAQRRSRQLYDKASRPNSDVFSIINNIMAGDKVADKDTDEESSRNFKKHLESSSERWLNVEKVKTEENMERAAREVFELRNKLSTKKEGSTEFKYISSNLIKAGAKLDSLKKRDGKIAWEIKVRQTKKKMAF